MTIEHNDFERCGVGVFIKGDHEKDGFPQQDNVVRFNYIHDMQQAGVRGLASVRDQLYQNLIVNTNDEFGRHNGVPATGAAGAFWMGFGAPQGTVIANNTIDNCMIALHLQQPASHQKIQVRNNIFSNCRHGVASFANPGDPTAEYDVDRNVYYAIRMSERDGALADGLFKRPS